MRTYPFDGYLEAWADQYRSFYIGGSERYVWHHELDALSFPVPASFLSRASRAGHLPSSKHKGRTCYTMTDLIGFVRMHSLPGYGLYFKHPVRPAEVLAHGPEGIAVAAAFLQSERRPNAGQLCFVCPLCSTVHFHGTGPGFGGGDGPRAGHCSGKYYRMDAQRLYQPGKYPYFILQEVEDPRRAGAFPREVSRHIVSRAPEGTEANA